MAKKPSPSISEHIRSYLLAVDPPPVEDATVAVTAAVKTAKAPILNALSSTSDLTFVDEIIAELQQLGLDQDVAVVAAAAVLTAPTLSLRHARDANSLLQAVILSRDEQRTDQLGSSDLNVVLRVAVQGQIERPGMPRQPPSVISFTVEGDFVDLDNDDDLGTIGYQVLQHIREYPVLPRRRRHRDPSVTIVGSPNLPGNIDVPESWRKDLQTIAAAFATDLHLDARSTNDIVDAPDASVHGFALDPSAKRRLPEAIESTVLDSRVHSWSTLLGQLIATLATALDEGAEPSRSRALASGEHVFHRKVRNSRKFDVFDDGTDTPCSHGAAGFVPWTNSPKAVKGMARRYDNFDSSMLRHCNKYPNCGVYAVFAPA